MKVELEPPNSLEILCMYNSTAEASLNSEDLEILRF